MRNGEFNDPHLVAVYDADFSWSRQDDFFSALISDDPQSRVLDLGCGTGRLALGLAAAGHVVTGIDPASASIDAARRKPGADTVTWIVGTSRAAPDQSFDAALMTSHVAQFLVTDTEWADTLADLRRALVPGGRLVFDSRDPDYRAWESWNPVDTRHAVELPGGTEVVVWSEVTAVDGDIVDFTLHYECADGVERLSSSTLRFRSVEELRSSLNRSGFTVEDIYGGWRGEPVNDGDGEFIVVARAD